MIREQGQSSEHRSVTSALEPETGSSPRVRGTLAARRRGRRLARFIPARAGNTGNQQKTHPPIQVHPRACGEHERFNPVIEPLAGSSPRVRGTLFIDLFDDPILRFIPARAGNT